MHQVSSACHWFKGILSRLRGSSGRPKVQRTLNLDILEKRLVPAFVPVLVKDLNPGNPDSEPRQFTVVGSTLFFTANDAAGGRELWKSDGTALGTFRVKDINPGAASSNPLGLTAVGGLLFFSANDGTSGRELWKSDGTEIGTVRVKDINPGGADSSPGYSGNIFRHRELVNLNGTLVFSADDGTNGIELWKSDGTEQGTMLIKDIRPGGNSYARYLAEVNGIVFFSAFDNANGFELWKSDGTNAGTTLVKDIRVGTGFSDPKYLTNANGTLYFVAEDATSGRELWKSDGSQGGTSLVADINTGATNTDILNLTPVGNTLFFVAGDASGRELWKTDGSNPGTGRIADIRPGPDSSSPRWMTNFAGTLFFSAEDATNGFELRKSDGTSQGTSVVKEINPGSGNANPTYLTVAGNTLFFAANDGTNGEEVWQTDGTTAGTVLVGNIRSGIGNSYPRYLTNVAGSLFFAATDGVNGFELWKLAPSNQAPSISVSAAVSVQENSTTVLTATASDPDPGTTLTYSLSGADANFFSIGSSTGVLTFNTAPDFEAPADIGNDNVYNITVMVFDGALSDSKAVAVTVTNVNEAPVSLVCLSAIAENSGPNAVLGPFSTTDPDAGDSFTYALVPGAGDGDNGLFNVSGGQLRANAAFDFEIKSSYSIRVRTTDSGGLSFERQFTITVTDDPNELSIGISPSASFVVFREVSVTGVTVADPTAGSFRLTTVLTAPGGKVSLGARSGLQFLAGDGTDDSTMRFTGTVSQTAAALKSLTYLHSSSSFSDTRIDISVQSKTSTVSKSIPLTAANGVTAKVPDIGHPSSGMVSLIIHGTPGADTVVVAPLAGSKTDFRVTVNNVSSTVRGITGRFIVGGLGGDDNINLSAVGIAARVDGGDGNDVIQTSSGQDMLFGGNGADLIAGGLGADSINGGAGNDIVIDGTLSVRAAGKTLRSVLDGWAATATPVDADYASITTDLLFTADKASKDTLTGGLGTDWFWSATAGAVADVLDRALLIERRRLFNQAPAI